MNFFELQNGDESPLFLVSNLDGVNPGNNYNRDNSYLKEMPNGFGEIMKSNVWRYKYDNPTPPPIVELESESDSGDSYSDEA